MHKSILTSKIECMCSRIQKDHAAIWELVPRATMEKLHIIPTNTKCRLYYDSSTIMNITQRGEVSKLHSRRSLSSISHVTIYAKSENEENGEISNLEATNSLYIQ